MQQCSLNWIRKYTSVFRFDAPIGIHLINTISQRLAWCSDWWLGFGAGDWRKNYQSQMLSSSYGAFYIQMCTHSQNVHWNEHILTKSKRKPTNVISATHEGCTHQGFSTLCPRRCLSACHDPRCSAVRKEEAQQMHMAKLSPFINAPVLFQFPPVKLLYRNTYWGKQSCRSTRK